MFPVLVSASDLDVFRPWSGEHLATILLTFGLPIVGGRWARRDPTNRRGHSIAVGIAVVLLIQVVVNLAAGWPAKSHWSALMPLHLCHLALFACVDACLTRREFSFELAYFWGLAGTLQGLITPGLSAGFPSVEFVLFFLGHGGIVSCVLFLMVAFRMRPRRGSVVRAYVAILGYAVVAGGFNAVTGQNYGFLCAKPAVPTLFDWLGPWPWYLGSAAVLCAGLFGVLYVPWEIADRKRLLRQPSLAVNTER